MEFKQEILINANPHVIFEQYKNVDSWKLWDAEVKESSLSGDFKVGTTGSLQPTKGPKANFTLTEVSLNTSFTSQTKLPLCTMAFVHTLEEVNAQTKVTHRVIFTGLTRFIFGRLIGSQIKKSLPDTLQGLKKACE
jgi:hypothetical protein